MMLRMYWDLELIFFLLDNTPLKRRMTTKSAVTRKAHVFGFAPVSSLASPRCIIEINSPPAS